MRGDVQQILKDPRLGAIGEPNLEPIVVLPDQIDLQAGVGAADLGIFRIGAFAQVDRILGDHANHRRVRVGDRLGLEQALDDARLDAQELAFDPAIAAAGDTDVEPILIALQQVERRAGLELGHRHIIRARPVAQRQPALADCGDLGRRGWRNLGRLHIEQHINCIGVDVQQFAGDPVDWFAGPLADLEPIAILADHLHRRAGRHAPDSIVLGTRAVAQIHALAGDRRRHDDRGQCLATRDKRKRDRDVAVILERGIAFERRLVQAQRRDRGDKVTVIVRGGWLSCRCLKAWLQLAQRHGQGQHQCNKRMKQETSREPGDEAGRRTERCVDPLPVMFQ